MSTLSPATEGASPACWSQPGGKVVEQSACPTAAAAAAVPVWNGGNGAVLWLLSFCIHRNPITPYVLSLAMAGFTFLLSIIIPLGLFSVPESFCHQLGSWGVTAGLKVPILLAFTAAVSCLTALSAVTALSVCPRVSCWPCHCSQCFPMLLCALLWLLSFLLTAPLHCCSLVPMASVLSCLFSVLSLTCSALALMARLLCCPWKQLPGKLCALLLLLVMPFPFFTADFGLWLLLRAFDFSVFAASTSLLLTCAKSSALPLIHFLAGSCAKEFTSSGSVALQRAFEAFVPEPGHRDNTVESSSSGIIMKDPQHNIEP
ncbi:LOW QUALITY PROTEIN: mas-related G-protein coupled receptor member A-like [Agelaius phoeniceus]|uniref:LOW QUALITY PROTEIN: mas-related G-protein coupled receptor member A-like n=1 Tax=Agelaius phoeniceus TaxID=39638 RepID=UPI004054E093